MGSWFGNVWFAEGFSLQVYEPGSGKYRHFNKYEGRKITEENIKDAIAQYFWNGKEYRVDALAKLAETLRRLIEVVQSDAMTCHYRFYATSLLLLYEGDTRGSSDTPVDLKMIDFAHTFPFQEGDPMDDGHVFGLKNFLTILEQIAKEHS